MRHITLDCELGYGFLLFGIVKQVSENLGLFLLLTLVSKLFNSDWFARVFVHMLSYFRGKSSKFVLDGTNDLLHYCFNQQFDNDKDKYKPLIDDKLENVKEKDVFCTDDDHTCNGTDVKKECAVEDDEFDLSVLRSLIKAERQRANAALVELEKERAASATAAEEAMAMILRLQNEKSLIELESSQFRRLAEEKQIHDQKVIESLQWLVWRHESERGLLEDQLKSCKRRLTTTRFSKINESEEEVEGYVDSFNGNLLDALENVLYSSRDGDSLTA